MRVAAGVLLDRCGGAAVGVALAQDRVDGAALDPVVAGADLALLGVGGLVGVAGKLVAVGLELGDRRLELRHGGADVRQLDDVRLGRRGQLAQLGERVGQPLILGQQVGELGQDPARERDVAKLDLDPGDRGERLHDRQQRLRGERGSLVGVRVDDVHVCAAP